MTQFNLKDSASKGAAKGDNKLSPLPLRVSNLLRESKNVREAMKARVDAHHSFLIALESDAMKDLIKDGEAFCDLVAIAISDFGVKQIDIAKTLDLSTAAVGRWAAHKNAPRQYARGMVLEVIRSLVAKGLSLDGVLEQDS